MEIYICIKTSTLKRPVYLVFLSVLLISPYGITRVIQGMVLDSVDDSTTLLLLTRQRRGPGRGGGAGLGFGLILVIRLDAEIKHH